MDGNLTALLHQLPEGIWSWNAKSGGQSPQSGQRTFSEALLWVFTTHSWASGCLSFFLFNVSNIQILIILYNNI